MQTRTTTVNPSIRVSIITACYNAADTLLDTIESVAGQRCDATDFEIEHIVIDGASTDSTRAIIDSNRGRLAAVVSEPDEGLYHAMNKGLALARGDIVGILNADDVYQDDLVIDRVVSAFQTHGVDSVYGDLVYVRRNNLSSVVRYWTSQVYRNGLFLRGWIPAHPTFFVRGEIYRRYGVFDLEYKYQADFELCLRFLAIHGITSHYLPRILVRMRMGGVTNNSIVNIIKGNLESYRACQRHNLPVNPLFFLRKLASRVPQFFTSPKRLP